MWGSPFQGSGCAVERFGVWDAVEGFGVWGAVEGFGVWGAVEGFGVGGLVGTWGLEGWEFEMYPGGALRPSPALFFDAWMGLRY